MEEDLEEDLPQQVKIKSIDYKPMDVDEAVLQMDLTSDNFLVFTNIRKQLSTFNDFIYCSFKRYGLPFV